MWAIILLPAIFSITKCATYLEKKYTYSVAVVEYKPIKFIDSISDENKANLEADEYIHLLESVDEELDLILFPESTLRSLTEVPEPFTEVICNSKNTIYADFLKKFSCAAIKFNTTIVINVNEKENCTSSRLPDFCPSSGIINYNTDVIFNEDGYISGRYRKWNLFGEYSKSPPSEVELVTVTTKSNDTFGIFTCFDIMFYQPALNLTKQMGVQNILFPAMWFSELPYLTALQVQQMWAEENNVNFMSSGANQPVVGSGGTGIFLGKDGPLAFEMVGGEGGTRVLVKRVARPEIANNPYRVIPLHEEDTDAIAREMDTFYLKTSSSIKDHTSVVLDTTKSETIEEVCNGDDIRICCQFDIKLSTDQNKKANLKQYTYHLTAFNGIRSFDGVKNGGIETCAILACLNETTASCGQRFPNYTEITWPVTIESVKITGNFTKDENRIQFPNSLLSSIRPISPKHRSWRKAEFGQTVYRSHFLHEPSNRLLTFGIYGRDFNRDSIPVTSS